MKKNFYILCLALSALSLCAKPEGWFDGQAERVEPGSFIMGNGGDGGVMPLTASSPMVVASDDSALVELARGLQHDPVRIFNHVRDNIAYTPYFGLLKGAQQTLLERSGNDFDQAALLFRLLELSGYAPVYGYGMMVIPFFNLQQYDIASWLKTQYNFDAIDTILANGGIPFGYHGYIDYSVNRVWVEVVIEGTTYKLDPAFKRHYASAGLDIRSMMGYSRSDLLSTAGGTTVGSYIQNLNQANLFTYLDGLATNLHAILKRDYNDISMDELLDDVGVIPEPVTELPTSLRFPVSSSGIWTTIPAEYYHIVSITNETLNVTLKTSDMAGRRLSITYAPAGTTTMGLMGGEGEAVPTPEESAWLDESFIFTPSITNTTVVCTNFPSPSPPEVMPLATYSFDYGRISTWFLPYKWGGTWNSGAPGAWDYKIVFDSNGGTTLGAFTIAQGGGTANNVTGGRTFYVNFSAVGQTRGTKTARLKLSCKPSNSSTWFHDYYDLSGFVAAAPNIQHDSGYNSVQTYYQEPVYETYTFRNAGNYAMTVTAMSRSGGTPSQFALLSGSGAGTIAVNATRSIGWRFNASEQGLFSTYINFGVTYDGITYSAQNLLALQGKAHPSPDVATLWLDDEPIAVESGSLWGRGSTLTIAIDHPYAADNNTYADQTVTYPLKRGGTYAIVHGFGGSETGFPLERRRRRLESYMEQGLALTSREIQTESLNLVGQGWMEQTAMQETLLNRLAGVRRIIHHRFGLAAQEEGCYVDVKAQFSSGGSASGSLSESTAAFKSLGLFNSALEHSIIEQTLGAGNTAASTISLLTLANAQNVKIHFADSNNFNSVKTLLTGYSANNLSALSDFTASGGLVVLPENGNLTLGQWSGRGYIGYSQEGTSSRVIQMIISGDYGTQHGGYSANPVAPTAVSANTWDTVSLYTNDELARHDSYSYDPVNLATGCLIYNNSDLTLGGSSVRGLGIARHYSAFASDSDGVLGYGWTHSYDIRTNEYTDYKSAFGRRAPCDAIPMLVASTVLLDLLGDTGGSADVKRWMCAVLATHWATEYVTRNTVSIAMGDQALSYVKRPGSGFEAPPGVTTQLEKSGGTWRLVERFGTERIFNPQGRLASVKDVDGCTLTLTYNTQTNLTTVTDHYGRTLTFGYANGHLSTVSDSTGRSVSYNYTNGDLTSYSDPEGNQWRYTYDNAHRLLTITDPLGTLIASNKYDSVGRVMQQWNAHGNMWDFRYSDFETREIAPDGGVSIYYFDSNRRETGQEIVAGYRTYLLRDGQDRVTHHYDENDNLTIQSYDASHNLTNCIDALGNQWSYVYDVESRLVSATDPRGNVTDYEYNTSHRPILVTDALGNTTAMTYQETGINRGLLLSTTQLAGHKPLVTSYTYDNYGQPATITNPDEGTIQNNWNARGDLLTSIDPRHNTTTFTYDKRRLITSSKDAQGSVTTNRYNAAGNIIESRDPLNRATLTTWTPSYEKAGVLYPDGGITTNTYDINDRPLASIDPRGTVTSNCYDRAGRIISSYRQGELATQPLGISHFVYDPVGNLLTTTNALGFATHSQYDGLNRPVAITDPLNNTTTSAYDAAGNLISTTDPNNKTRQWLYDAQNRSTATIRPSGATDRFGYDAIGNQTVYTNSEGNVYAMAYDTMGRMTAATNALGEEVFRSWYDFNGNITNRIDGADNRINYSYDALNRLIARSGFNHETHENHEVFEYDVVGNILSASNENAQLSFTYDAMDRLATASTTLTTDHLPPTTYQSGYAYDAGGLLTNLTYTTGKSVSYIHDQDGLLTSVKDWNNNEWHFTRDAMGKLTGISSPDGNNSSFDYDAANRLTSWSVGSIAGRTITYDAAGRRIRDDITAGAVPKPILQRTAQNTFDAADKLISTSVRYGQGTNSTPHITETFSYNGNGAMTNWLSGENSLSLSYNSQNQLSSLQTDHLPLTTNHFQYDALGNRLVAGSIVWIPDHSDSLKRPLMECDENGNIIRYYIWGDNRLLGFIDSSGTLTVAHSDETGNVITLTDTNGNVIYTANYGPHGEDWGSSGTNPTPFTWLGGYGVQTINSDTPLRLYLTRHRIYSATLNRFLSSDPLGISGGLNLYTYGEGNPLAYIDPLGLAPTTAEAAVMANHIYGAVKGNSLNNTLMGGWTLSRVITAQGTGLAMGEYSRINPSSGQMEYTLVNKGTTVMSASDWRNNIAQPFGGSGDMKASIAEATKFVDSHPGFEVTMIGHSKGGAEAAANAVATGANAILFNPATVNLDAYSGTKGVSYSGDMTAYIVQGEVLNNIFGPVSKPIGDAAYLPQQHGGQWYNLWQTTPVDAVLNHLMPAVHNSLKQAGYK